MTIDQKVAYLGAHTRLLAAKRALEIVGTATPRLSRRHKKASPVTMAVASIAEAVQILEHLDPSLARR